MCGRIFSRVELFGRQKSLIVDVVVIVQYGLELSAKHTFLPTSPTITLLTSFLAAINYKNTFLRTLVPSVGQVYGIQAAVAIPSILVKNEQFYDFSGSITYLSYTALSLFLPTIRARSAAALTGASKPAWPSLLSVLNGQGGPLGFNWMQVALSAAVSI